MRCIGYLLQSVEGLYMRRLSHNRLLHDRPLQAL
jgi:hypothetical protein